MYYRKITLKDCPKILHQIQLLKYLGEFISHYNVCIRNFIDEMVTLTNINF